MTQSLAAPIVDTIPIMLADATEAAPFSLRIFIVLLLIVLGSMSMFLVLAVRWTVPRRKVARTGAGRINLDLRCGRAGRLSRATGAGGCACGDLPGRKGCDAVAGEDADDAGEQASGSPVAVAFARSSRRGGDWPVTALLRPAARATSVVDLLSVSSFPSLLPPERFVVFGTGGEAAAALSESHVPALLPHDVGLVLAGSHLILDFSGRAFDELEFNRLREPGGAIGGENCL